MKIYTESDIIELLKTNDKAVTKAVIAIYNRQTEHEQEIGDTKVHNNIGFNACDAKYLSWCAKYCIKLNAQLTGKHLEKCRTKILKYRKQLLEIANSKVKE